jgi:hypothetical protein
VPVVLDYKGETTVASDAAGGVSQVTLRLAAGTALPEAVTAYVIADVFPLSRQALP